MTAIASPRGRGVTINFLRSAARGAALIGVAVVLGILLLQVVDKSGIPSGGGSGGGSNGATTTTTEASTGRPAAEITVIVLNGSGVTGRAANLSNELRGLGYMILNPGDTTNQQGNTVACVPGFDREADVLAELVGFGATTVPFTSPPPAGAETANCVVILGT